MTPDDLSKIDLRLLVVFNALMEERSVTRAAVRLGLSQPATSRNLRQLRQLFGDDLFIRQSHGLAPSPRAEQLYQQLKLVLDDILRLVAPVQLQPQTLERRFRISTIDPISQGLITPLLSYLEEHAPGVTLKIQNLENHSMDALIAGHLDFIINFGDDAPANIHSRILFKNQPICLMSRDHPLAGLTSISREQYAQQNHVDFIIPGFLAEELPPWLLNDRQVKLETNNMVTALNAICDRQFCMIGSQMLTHFSPRAADLCCVPFASEQPIPKVNSRLLWHRRYHEDAAHRWLRGVIQQLMEEQAQYLDTLRLQQD